jgi:hypothetical protein
LSRFLLHTEVRLSDPLPQAVPRADFPQLSAAEARSLASGRPEVSDVFLGTIAKRPRVAITMPLVVAE